MYQMHLAGIVMRSTHFSYIESIRMLVNWDGVRRWHNEATLHHLRQHDPSNLAKALLTCG